MIVRLTMKTTLLSLLLLSLFSVLSFAQEPDSDSPARQRVEELRRMKMITALDLNEEQAVRLVTREKDFRNQERELQQQRRKLIGQLREASIGTGSDAEIEKLIAQIQTLSEDIVKRRFEYLTSLKDILSVKQMGKLVVFEEHFANELRRMLQRFGKGGGPPQRPQH